MSDIYIEGAKAYHSYKSRDANPYPINSNYHELWHAGYQDAKHGYINVYGQPIINYE